MVNGIVSLISLSVFSLLVYKNIKILWTKTEREKIFYVFASSISVVISFFSYRILENLQNNV